MRIYSEKINDFINVHPTFFYEFCLDITIFFILMKRRKKRKFKGELLYIYFMLYGIGRALIESVRADSLMFGNFKISQILSIILVFFSIILYFFGEKCRTKKSYKS